MAVRNGRAPAAILHLCLAGGLLGIAGRVLLPLQERCMTVTQDPLLLIERGECGLIAGWVVRTSVLVVRHSSSDLGNEGLSKPS